jgi:hypothetical protein
VSGIHRGLIGAIVNLISCSRLNLKCGKRFPGAVSDDLAFEGPRDPLSRRRASASITLELGLERRVSASYSGRQEMGQPQGRALHWLA